MKNKFMVLMLALILIISASGMALAHPGHEGGHDIEEITTTDVKEATQDSSDVSSSPSSSSSEGSSVDNSKSSSSSSGASSSSSSQSGSSSNNQQSSSDNYDSQGGTAQEVSDDAVDQVNKTNSTNNATNVTNNTNVSIPDTPKDNSSLYVAGGVVVVLIAVIAIAYFKLK